MKIDIYLNSFDNEFNRFFSLYSKAIELIEFYDIKDFMQLYDNLHFCFSSVVSYKKYFFNNNILIDKKFEDKFNDAVEKMHCLSKKMKEKCDAFKNGSHRVNGIFKRKQSIQSDANISSLNIRI